MAEASIQVPIRVTLAGRVVIFCARRGFRRLARLVALFFTLARARD